MTLVLLIYLVFNEGEIVCGKIDSHVLIFFSYGTWSEKKICTFDWSCFQNVYQYDYEQVIAGVMEFLSLRIPPFIRIDLLKTIFTQASSLGN